MSKNSKSNQSFRPSQTHQRLVSERGKNLIFPVREEPYEKWETQSQVARMFGKLPGDVISIMPSRGLGSYHYSLSGKVMAQMHTPSKSISSTSVITDTIKISLQMQEFTKQMQEIAERMEQAATRIEQSVERLTQVIDQMQASQQNKVVAE